MTIQLSTVRTLRAIVEEAEARGVTVIAVADLRAALDKSERKPER